jgi:uncharacterized membrane protein YoaK (UPF0700 family)
MPDRIPVARRWAVAALLLLTAATGLIDAVSYLALGRVFVHLGSRPRRWLAIAFGGQAAVLALAADSVLGGGEGARPHRRLGSVVAMFAGAAVGALLLQATIAGVLFMAAILVVIAGVLFRFAPAER